MTIARGRANVRLTGEDGLRQGSRQEMGQSYGLLQNGPMSLPGSYLEDPARGSEWKEDAGSGSVCPCPPLLQGARASGVLLFPMP